MSYIDSEEFKALTNVDSVDEEKFNRWLTKASDVLDSVTNSFYQFHDINKDKYSYRVEQFKKALCAQIIYFNETGTDTYEGLNNAPQSVSIGSTNVSMSSRYSSKGQSESKSLVADEVYMYLQLTGLLYRGVRS